MDIPAVTLKLPTFWQTSPSAWFAQVEAQFALRSITNDETKYYHVVVSLDTDTANRALCILSSPPTQEKYKTIKSFLLSAFELSEDERALALFNLHGLGDRKPSELMDIMLGLLGSHKPCFLFKHLFIQQLPDYIRTALAQSNNKEDFRALALEADQLFIAGSKSHQVVQEVKVKGAAESSLCWYHWKFGKNAKKCLPHCSKFKKNQGNGSLGQQ